MFLILNEQKLTKYLKMKVIMSHSDNSCFYTIWIEYVIMHVYCLIEIYYFMFVSILDFNYKIRPYE